MRAALSRRKREERVTVKTAKGEEFAFDGISEKFTRKLWEWEERKGIAPELSTIALLNPEDEAKDKGRDSDANNNGEGKSLARSRSEGSLNDGKTAESASDAGNGSAKGSGGSLNNSSQSLNDLRKEGVGNGEFSCLVLALPQVSHFRINFPTFFVSLFPTIPANFLHGGGGKHEKLT